MLPRWLPVLVALWLVGCSTPPPPPAPPAVSATPDPQEERQHLRDLLRHEVATARQVGLERFLRQPDPELLSEIVALALSDPEPSLRRAAIVALGEVGGEQAAPHQVVLLAKADEADLREVWQSLVVNAAAVLPLIEASYPATDEALRERQVVALGYLHSPLALEPLKALLVRPAAANCVAVTELLALQGEPGCAFLLDQLRRELLDNCTEAALTALHPCGEPALALLGEYLDANATVNLSYRTAACRGLGKMQNPAAIALLRGAARSGETLLRVAAVNALTTANAREAAGEFLLAAFDPEPLLALAGRQAVRVVLGAEDYKTLVEVPDPAAALQRCSELPRLDPKVREMLLTLYSHLAQR